MKELLKKIFSKNPDASYGRMLSFLAFVAFLAFSLLVLINPWSMIKLPAYIEPILQYLFFLVAGGYGITSGKDILAGWVSKLTGKKDQEEK